MEYVDSTILTDIHDNNWHIYVVDLYILQHKSVEEGNGEYWLYLISELNMN